MVEGLSIQGAPEPGVAAEPSRHGRRYICGGGTEPLTRLTQGR